MRIQSDLIQDDYQELKKESKEVLGLEGELYPPFGSVKIMSNIRYLISMIILRKEKNLLITHLKMER